MNMKDFEDALLDISRANLDSAAKKHNDIDNKAIGIITISGILISFLLGFSKPNNGGSSVLFILTALSFLVTVSLSIIVLRPRKVHELSTQILIDELKTENPEYQVSRTIASSAKIEDELQDICNSKAFELSRAIQALGISVMVLILFSLSIYF